MFSNWQVLDENLQSQNFVYMQVHIARFSITPIRDHSIIVIKDSLNLIIFYFIHPFWNFSNWDGTVSNNVQLYTKFRAYSLSSRTCHFIQKV